MVHDAGYVLRSARVGAVFCNIRTMIGLELLDVDAGYISDVCSCLVVHFYYQRSCVQWLR